jgi:energy-converting hydrogenase Eha subunit H
MKSILIKVIKESWFATTLILIFFIIIYQSEKNFKEETKNIRFKGKVITKYNDKNDHNRAKFGILLYNGKTFVYDLENDKSGLFEYVIQGDSIEKESNGTKVRVFNSLKDTIFILEF